MKKRFSFTLVEILVVTVLVSLLAAIGFAGYSYAMTASRRAATEALIQQMSAALENFKLKNGYYPASASYKPIRFTQNSGMINTLAWGPESSDKKIEWKKGEGSEKYLKSFLKVLDQENLKKNISSDQLVDSWGGVVYYRYPGVVNTNGFDLIAPGEDGKFGVAAANVPAVSPTATTYKENNEWACDDISNFMDK